MSSSKQPDSRNKNLKEELYDIYYLILSELNINVEEDTEEYQEKVKNASSLQITNYIKESLGILIKEFNRRMDCDNHVEKAITPIDQYERTLQKYEKDIRLLMQRVFEYKFQMEVVQSTLDEYAKIEEEYEEMKVKLKYEDGKFLDNDRKENEILILRAENTNLKGLISKLEEKNSMYKEKVKESQSKTKKLLVQNEKLLKQLEKAQKDLNMFSSINININNDLSPSSPHSMSMTKKASQEDQVKIFTLNKIKAQAIKKRNNLLKHRNNSLNMLLDTQKIEVFSRFFTNKQPHTTKKNLVENHLMSNYNASSNKCLKIKKIPFNNNSVSQRNFSSRNSNEKKIVNNSIGNNTLNLKSPNTSVKQKIVLISKRNSKSGISKNQKYSVSFG